VRPEDGQARPKHIVTFDNKIQNQDSCVFRQIPPSSFDVQKHNGDDEPEGIGNSLPTFRHILTFEDGTNRLSRNFDKELPLHAA
jgi:hypothetical protein